LVLVNFLTRMGIYLTNKNYSEIIIRIDGWIGIDLTNKLWQNYNQDRWLEGYKSDEQDYSKIIIRIDGWNWNCLTNKFA
jgi:reverse gyrase